MEPVRCTCDCHAYPGLFSMDPNYICPRCNHMHRCGVWSGEYWEMLDLLRLSVYWKSEGDELAGNATLVFHFLNNSMELIRVFHLEELVTRYLVLYRGMSVSQCVIRMAVHHLIESGMMKQEDLPKLISMVDLATRFILHDLRKPNYTKRAILQQILDPRVFVKTEETNWELKEFHDTKRSSDNARGTVLSCTRTDGQKEH